MIGFSYDGASGDLPGTGPIRPGETRRKTVELGTVPSNVFVTPTMALFADLSSQGDSKDIARVFEERRHQATVWSAWASELNALEGASGDRTRRRLQTLLADDPRFAADSADPDGQAARMAITELLQTTDPSDFQKRATAIKERFVRRHDVVAKRLR